MSDFIPTDEFVRHLLTVCAQARSRASESKYGLDWESARELVRWAVRNGRIICHNDGLKPSEVDDRLCDAEFYDGHKKL